MGIQSDISRLKFNKTTTTYKFDKGNQTICLRIRERVVRTGVVERTRTTTRSVNSPSRKKVKNTPKSSRCLVMVASKPSASTAPNVSHTSEASSKKVWINQGDIILLSLRDYQDEKGDVILKYSADEARSLKAYGELPESAKINETDTYGQEGDGDCNFEFDEDRSESEDEDGKGKEIDVDDI